MPGGRIRARCESATSRSRTRDVHDENVVIRGDEASVPTTTSAAAGGIRCSLNDMLTWIRVWLDPELRDASGKRWLVR